MQRQVASPLSIRGLKAKPPQSEIEVKVLKRVEYDDRMFDEGVLQDLLFKHPSLLPISEIEPLFDGASSICRELPVNGAAADLLLMNSDGLITVVETKL